MTHSPFRDGSRRSTRYRAASIAVLSALSCALLGGEAFAHDMRFGPAWNDLQFMDDSALDMPSLSGPAEVVMVVDVLEVRGGRGKQLANSITGRITKRQERSGVLAEEQYRELLRSVNEGQNLRAFQSTVVTSPDRLGTTSWTPEGASGQAVVNLRFARDDGGLWVGTVELRTFDDDKALQAEYRTVANRLFLRGKSGADWLLVVTVLEQTNWDLPTDSWPQQPSWSPESGFDEETWQ